MNGFFLSIRDRLATGSSEFYLGNFSIQITLQAVMHLVGLTGIKFSFAGLTLPLGTLIILLISGGIAVFTLGITLSPRVDYLSGFVLLSLLFFFLFRDVWEHHYV
ncbi:hypothetical protein J7M23_10915, partial [Candidatus Sumerlaeota bacterium]|nr:hypothetical protein [Candidatus Sumerlaeota bacterium]